MQDLKQSYINHPARHIEQWLPLKALNFSERVIISTPSINHLIKLDGILYGYDESPSTPTRFESFKEMTHLALASIPPEVIRLVEPYFYGVALIKGIDSNGITLYLRDERGLSNRSFMVLNTESLKQKINDWATWKENLPFKGAPVNATLAHGVDNDIVSSIRFILLHELAHIYAEGVGNIHPSYRNQKWNCKSDPLTNYPFTAISWEAKLKNCQISPKKPISSRKIEFFKNAKLSDSKARALYKKLHAHSLPSLYGATRYTEDFAEAFALFVHTELLNQPYIITYKSRGSEKNYYGCKGSQSCQKKYAFIRSLLHPDERPSL